MIAKTVKNGNSVQLSADFQIDTEKVEYKVYCKGTEFIFPDFAPAARIYKDLSRFIEDGWNCEYLKIHLKKMAAASRALGFSVNEPDYAKEVA